MDVLSALTTDEAYGKAETSNLSIESITNNYLMGLCYKTGNGLKKSGNGLVKSSLGLICNLNNHQKEKVIDFEVG